MQRIGARSPGGGGPQGMRSIPSQSKGRPPEKSTSGRRHPSQNAATNIENLMRYSLLRKGIDFIEQANIGPWCVDFYLPKYNACVEADGEYWHGTVSAKMKDRRKDAWLKKNGYKVFHFDGWDIKQDSDFCVSRMMKSLDHMSSPEIEIEDDPPEIIEDLQVKPHEEIQPRPSGGDEYEQWISGQGNFGRL